MKRFFRTINAATAALLAFLIAAVSGAAAPARADTPLADAPGANTPTPARFETNLLPDSPIAGQPGWPLLSRMRHYRVPGVQVALVTNGRISWTRGYGFADAEHHRRVTTETVFDAGSISKVVTALAILRLAEQEKLSLDAPVNTLLQSWQLPENEFTRKTPVTIRHLLSHTAGTNVGGFWGYLENQPLPTLRQILDGLPPAANGPVRVEKEPGTAWRYSGGGYVILQQVIEDVTKMPFAAAIHTLVFSPLKMHRSTVEVHLPPALRSDSAQPSSEASYFKGKRLHPHAAAAGLYTTAADLARLIQAMLESLRQTPGAFLTPPSARLLVEPVVRDREPWDRTLPNRRNTQKDQALGLMLLSRDGAPGETVYAYHDGLNAGFRSRLIFDPIRGDGMVLLANYDGDEEFLLEATRAAAATGGWKDFVPEPLRPIRLSANELERYTGRYRRTEDNVVHIRREGDHLVWSDLWTVPQPIYPVGNDQFEHRELFGRASTFTRTAAGQAATLDGWPRITDPNLLPVEYLLRGDSEKGVALLRADTTISEERLGNIGFNLLEVYRLPRAAVGVYQVLAERFPGSAGGWDALGDALRRRGDRPGGQAAEHRAEMLRAVRDRLTAAFESGGVADGCRVYRAVRFENGAICLGDLLERLSRRLEDAGKLREAAAVRRLALYDQRVFSRAPHSRRLILPFS